MTNMGFIFKINKEFIKQVAKKTNNPIKIGQKTQIDISPKKIHRWPTGNKKMLNFTNHYRNANQIHNEISPHISQNDYHQKVYT